MKINDMFKNVNGEVATVVEVDETRKTCMIEFADGRTKSLTFSTLKDKRRWTPVEDELVPMPGAEKLAELKQEVEEPKRLKEAREKRNQAESDLLEETAKVVDKIEAKKASKKNLIEYNGKSLTLHGWAKELNIPFGTLYARVTRFHWTYEEALSGVKNK